MSDRELAPGFQPRFDLKSTILDMTHGLQKVGFQDDAAYHESEYMRLNVISRFREQGLLDKKLRLSFIAARGEAL